MNTRPIDPGSGWLADARRVVSPNRDRRPEGVSLDLIVIHAISLPPGQFGGPWIENLFTNRLNASAHPYFYEIRDLRVSAHVLIRRDGERVQFVSFNEQAWHAGKSSFEGRDGCNDFSVGIELEGCDELAFEPVQYDQLARLIRALCAVYPSLSPQRVVGHADIAPGRKTDPGPRFNWNYLNDLLQGGTT